MSEGERQPDVFSLAWRAGYVGARTGRAASESVLELAEGADRADMRDGWETGRREALALPHRIVLRTPAQPGSVAMTGETELEVAMSSALSPEIGFYAGDPCQIAVLDADGNAVAWGTARVIRADLRAETLGVYIETWEE